ncbi:ATP-binding cassette subfamily B protein [Paenibacillus eucommiae]|uniref:ATP-binding cassette subfamily B protein n=2 Tax=Paenibacillus eucommiae TaxID=1355755 RepID=A0ABS4IU09_9BACL|nr:ATP-binding cassette subfamily B protein [Paenibacillus eucommiae]
MMLANIIQSLYPKVLGDFTDLVHKNKITEAAIIDYSLLLLVIGISCGIFFGVGQYVVMRLGRIFEFITRGKLFNHFIKLSESYYSKHGVGELLSYVMNDVTAVRESISQGINQTTNAVIITASAIVMMVISSIPLYLIVVCVLPLLIIPWLVVWFGPAIRSRSKQVQESLARMTEAAEEQFGGIRVTKKFAVEGMMKGRFGEKVDHIRDNQLSLVRISSLFQAILPFLGSLSLIIAIIFGGYLTIKHEITLGNFVSLTLYLRMMVNPLQQIGNVINTMQRSQASLDRINQLLAIEPDIKEIASARTIQKESNGIRMKALTFSYPDASRKALEDIHIHLPAGQTLGIVGKTGSGKTTLVKLLLRIYDPPKGTVFIGDTDVRQATLESLRNQIAYVPQDGFLFSTTIRDNIAFSNRDEAMDVIEMAAQQAKIDESIQTFAEQYETKLGERGVTLSGGQRQRTSLARGFIKNAPILILDDSVSAVDAETETQIIENVRLTRKGKTTIIIAHRISAIQHADQIIVLDEGRIVQQGTHRQLLKEEGVYAALYAIQEGGTRYADAEGK